MDRKIAGLAKKVKAAKRKHDRAERAVSKARNEHHEIQRKYRDLIQPTLADLLRGLKWEWPGVGGPRELRAFVTPGHAIPNLIAPIDGYWRITVKGESVSVRYERDALRHKYVYRIAIPTQLAHILGIKNPKARRDWSGMRRRLTKAGITDEAKLAELLKATGGDK